MFVLARGVRWISTGAAVAAAAALLAADPPAAALKTAISAIEAKRYPAAVKALEGLASRLPALADYAAFYRATALSEAKDYAAVPAALEEVWRQTPPSPFRARAALLAADAYLKTDQPAAALQLLRDHYSELTQPLGDLAMADALAASGDGVGAAVYYQRVYYGYPTTQAASLAKTRGDKLRAELGENYPPDLPQAMLGRATRLMEAGDTKAAFAEFEAMIPLLSGTERELARVRMGVANYTAGQNEAAWRRLSALELESPEADSERLRYLSETARRLGKLAEMDEFALKAARLYPGLPHTIEALIAAGNRRLIDNDAERYEPLYQACFESLPADPRTGTCHWKVAWLHYLRRSNDAADFLRRHLQRYPESEQASAALYFLGRLAQQKGDVRSARAYFEEAVNEYPNQFYATLARQRLAELRSVSSAPAVTEFLRSVSFPQRARTLVFSVDSAGPRIGRARLLAEAGLRDLAERELAYGAGLGEQPHVLAAELAKLLAAENPAQALRYIKRYARGYLFMPLESAPQDFWQLAFPLPYREDLERFARQYNLDPFLLAGLIRQESEFDPQARSVAGARGLTQIQPATGRDIGKALKVAFSPARLYQPVYNLQFGSYYLRWTTDQVGGREEAALAAYNAGLTRARQWLKWAEFTEPAEFIETVPITQTREYIQAVLRNAAVYRQIYGHAAVAAAE
jgi:soluble lytic murein transglycosylase